MTIAHRRALAGLRWVTGAVVLAESSRLLTPGYAARAAGPAGIPQRLPLALAVAEILAAMLFLVPATLVAGGRALLAIFGAGAIVHVAHGQYHIGVLAVYAAAVAAVITGAQARNATELS
jgi:hypothetical protein